MNDLELLNEFLRHLRVERGLSENTWKTYNYHLNGFFAFLNQKNKNFSSATRNDILDYLEYKKNSGLKSASMFGIAISIRLFYRFLASFNYISEEPTKNMRIPKFTQKIPEPLSHSDMEKLLNMPIKNKFTDVRNKAMLELMYSTGIRISELLSLKPEQINYEEGYIKVLGKGNKERYVPLNNRAKEAINRYMEQRNQRFSLTDTYLFFLNSQGKRLTRGGFWWELKKMAIKAGISREVRPHMLRHTAATHLLAKGVDFRVLQELLGHASVVTTQRYVKVNLLLKNH